MENLADILIVDDLPTNLNVISNVLAPLGYSVATVTNGERALKQLQRAQPSLILLDIQMPGMDGLEAIQRIRCHSHLAQVPIIALTALAMEGDRDRCIAAGADEYMSKPIKLKQLVMTIAGFLAD